MLGGASTSTSQDVRQASTLATSCQVLAWLSLRLLFAVASAIARIFIICGSMTVHLWSDDLASVGMAKLRRLVTISKPMDKVLLRILAHTIRLLSSC